MALQSPNFTQVPNEILDKWMSELSGSSLKVLLKICRNTVGWGKEIDGISISQLMESTGYGKTQIIDAIKILILEDLIITFKAVGGTTRFKINYENEIPAFIKSEKHITKKDGYIYFILNKKESAVKIGNTKNLSSRFNHIRTANCSPVELIKIYQSEDVIKSEKELHSKFKKYCILGEWFKYSDSLKSFIDLIPDTALVQKVNTTCSESEPVLSKTCSESELTKESLKKTKQKKKKEGTFVPPTLDDINQYIKDNKLNVDGEFFLKYFTEGNWIDSKGHKVKNWKQKLITWDKHSKNKPEQQKANWERD